MTMTHEEKKRLTSVVSKVAIVIAVGIAYALFVRLTGWGIPCLFHQWTGKLCPGCGITRMFLALLRLDFATAARYNLLVLCLLPFALVLSICKVHQYVKTGHTTMPAYEKVFYLLVFALCVAFTILRNSGTIPFLTMP